MRRLLIAAVLLAGCSTAASPPVATVVTTLVPPASALNPSVTPATIHSTICVSGWTATVRPPVSYTDALKIAQIKARGYADTVPSHYEEDHAVPLELGGNPTDPSNLWPEPIAQARIDDHQETASKTLVCAGTETLDAARAQLWSLKKAHGL